MLRNSDIPKYLGIHVMSDGIGLLLNIEEAKLKIEDKLCDFNTLLTNSQTHTDRDKTKNFH